MPCPTSGMTYTPDSLHSALSTTARHWQGSGMGSHQDPSAHAALPGASPFLFAAAGLPVVASQPFPLVMSLPGMQQGSRAVGSGSLQWVGREGAHASPSLVPELGLCPR